MTYPDSHDARRRHSRAHDARKDRHGRSVSSRAHEADLIQETLQGNTEAFGELVNRYRDRLYNTIVCIVGCPAEAEDIVQETFVRAFVTLGRFRQSCAFYSWLYRVAVNLATNYLRWKTRRMSLDIGRELGANEPTDQGDSPMDKLLREERGPLITAALAGLSEEHRTILVLREVERYDYEAIAEILCVNIGTVRSRLYRARTRMRRLVNPVL